MVVQALSVVGEGGGGGGGGAGSGGAGSGRHRRRQRQGTAFLRGQGTTRRAAATSIPTSDVINELRGVYRFGVYRLLRPPSAPAGRRLPPSVLILGLRVRLSYRVLCPRGCCPTRKSGTCTHYTHATPRTAVWFCCFFLPLLLFFLLLFFVAVFCFQFFWHDAPLSHSLRRRSLDSLRVRLDEPLPPPTPVVDSFSTALHR